MGGMGPRLSLEGNGRNRVQPLLSVFALPIPRCLTHQKILSTERLYGIWHNLY